MSNGAQEPEVDWFIFTTGSLLVLAVIVPIVVVPDASRDIIASIFTFLTTELGVLYIVAATLIFTMLVVIAFSSWGRIVLGECGRGGVPSGR